MEGQTRVGKMERNRLGEEGRKASDVDRYRNRGGRIGDGKQSDGDRQEEEIG